MSENDYINKWVQLIKKNFSASTRYESHELGESAEVMVPMTDGVKLRTVIYFPRGEGPWSTVITRNPYPFTEEALKATSEEFAKRGYASIFQYCRGTGGSEGEWIPNDNERSDGIDALNWVSNQAWCKSIGIYGSSYSALTSWIIADVAIEKVKTIFLSHYSVDRYLSAYKDGLFRHDILTGWTMGNAGQPINADYIESCRYRPHIKVDEEFWGVKLDWYKDWITNTDYKCDYWQSSVWKTLREIPKKINIPMCIIAGWYDHHQEGTELGYETLNDIVKSNSKLIIGGWNHGMQPCVEAHKGKNADFNNEAEMIKWFEKILVKGELPEAEIKTYIIGEDRWQRWSTWTIQTEGIKILNLIGEKRNDCNAYKLSFQTVAEKETIEYDYDPENPVYSHGADTLLRSMHNQGSLLQEQAGYRDDILSFVSDPITEDICLAGKMNAKLFVSSDCEDTSFSVKIMEVLPNGNAYNIRSSITTLAYRNNSPARLTYTPGEIVEINIELLPVTWNIKVGSRVRIDITSSDFPQYAIHSNYTGVWSLQDKVKIAHQTIYCGGKYTSVIEIPVVKAF